MEQFPANGKEEENRVSRYTLILEGIKRIFSNVIQAKTEEELGNICLSVALEITGSQYGFIGEVGFDGRLHDIAISDLGWEQCTMYDKTGHSRLPKCFILHSLYGHIIEGSKWDNIIFKGKGFSTNDPQSHPYCIGVPQGHPPIRTFLCVPLVENGRMIGIIAVANREDGYCDEQLKDLQDIAPTITQALQRRKVEKALLDANEQMKAQSDELQMQSDELQKANETLEARVKERTSELETAYNSLKESERNLAEAEKMAHIGNWSRNLVTNELYWSDEMYRIFRLNPKSGVTYNVLLIHLHPEDRDYVDNAVKRAIKGEPFDIDHRIISDDGEERIVQARGKVTFDEKNIPTRISGTVQDITERKRTEEALRESEERFNLAVNAAQEGVWDWNMETNEVWYSPRYKEMLGYSEDEIECHVSAWLRLLHPDDKERTLQLVDEVMRGERNYELEFRLRHKNGHYLNILSRGYPVRRESDGKIVRIVGIHLDLTEYKQAEEEIRSLANIVESSDDAIITKSLNGIITGWNKGAEQIYGYSAEEILGKPIDILEPTILAGETERLNEMVKQGKKIQQYETLRLRKDGKILNVSLTVSPVFDTYGNLAAISVIARDITSGKEAKKAMERIEVARKQEIHHRIKNNLQVISSLLDLQAEQFRNKKSIKDYEVLDAFRESQDRVISMALIHEELYKGGGFATLNFVPYIKELAENLLQTYNLRNTDISLNMDLAENVFFDMDIAVPLGIIVNELVSNSLKHAFTGRDEGEIEIKLVREESIKFEGEDCESSNFVLTISDNGVGIHELDFEDLGSLGIQLITALVDQLDGEFELKSNNGTEFIMRFAVKENNS